MDTFVGQSWSLLALFDSKSGRLVTASRGLLGAATFDLQRRGGGQVGGRPAPVSFFFTAAQQNAMSDVKQKMLCYERK
jgi:hypothetical protein